MAADNKSLGRFILDGIPPAPRGMPQVEVTFDIDASGILTVSAKDKATGKEQNIVIKNATNLTEDEVEKMKQEAEIHAKEDEEKKSKTEERNKLDNTIFAAEKLIRDSGDKIKKEDKEKLEAAIKKAKDLLAKEETSKADYIKESEELNNFLQTVGTAIHQQAQKDQPSQTGSDQAEPETGEKEKKGNKKDDSEPEEGEIVN